MFCLSFKKNWPHEPHQKPPKPTKKPKKLKISKYVVWGVYGKVWSRRTRKLSFRLKNFFWNTLKAQKPQKLKIFKKRPKRCILLQNQKVCWLLTYHDSFISTLQIYAQKKEYKRYHSNFYHIDSTLTPHRLSTGLASQITILLALIPLRICEVWGSNQCDKNWSDIFYILFLSVYL